MAAQFVKGQMGANHLVHEGFCYVKDYFKSEKTYWKCCQYKNMWVQCPARAHTRDGEVVRVVGNHNHAPSPEDIDRKRIMSALKERALNTNDRPSVVLAQIIREEPPEVRGVIRSAEAACKVITRSRRRQNHPNVIPTNLLELVIPPKFEVIGEGENSVHFLKFDSGPEANRILIFSTDQNLRLLSRAKHIFADGTFKTTPQPLFEQLYTIHADLYGQVVLLVFTLMKQKDEETYARMIEAVKRLAPGLNPDSITTDYEMASINAFRAAFPVPQDPQAPQLPRTKGCWFHFGQCLWRRIQKLPDVLERYKAETPFAVQLKCLGALSFVPPEDVVEAYEELTHSPLFMQNYCLDPLLAYFERNWIGVLRPTGVRREPRHKIELWNNRAAVLNKEHLTTNSLEGWHRQLHSRIGACHPNIWKYLDCLQDEQILVEVKINQFLQGVQYKPPKIYRATYERVRNATLNWGRVGTLDFLRGIAHNVEWDV